MCLSLTQYLSAADNARDAVLLHVSASSARQRTKILNSCNEKKPERHILTHIHSCDPSVLCFYTLKHLVDKLHKT